jgi:hypothetical protein
VWKFKKSEQPTKVHSRSGQGLRVYWSNIGAVADEYLYTLRPIQLLRLGITKYLLMLRPSDFCEGVPVLSPCG